jgi:hypothetical protein
VHLPGRRRVEGFGVEAYRTRLRKAQEQCDWPVDTHAVLLDFAEDDGRLCGSFRRFLENYDGSSTSGSPLDAN